MNGASHPEEAASMKAPCCAPDAQHDAPAESTVAVAPGTGAGHADDMLLIEEGSFLMGSEDRWAYPADGEGPVLEVSLDSFRIDPVAVSNKTFASFVEATGYATEAERFLPTHLSFREIAERSFVSPNTVKTQAQAVYRKLDASSRAEAVDRAREAGLLRDETSTPVGQWTKS